MTTITLYNDGTNYSNQAYGNGLETVENYDFDSFGVQNGLPVTRFRLRDRNMTPVYLEVTMNDLKAVLCPTHWGKRRLTHPASEYIRTKALVALINGMHFADHCLYLTINGGTTKSIEIGVDPIGNTITSGFRHVDDVWAPVLLKTDAFLRIELPNKSTLLSLGQPDGHLVTHGTLEPFSTHNLNENQIGRNRLSNYALIHLFGGEFALVISEGMGLMDLVRHVVAMNSDVKGVTRDNLVIVREALLHAATVQLGWNMYGVYQNRDYEGWYVTQRFNSDTRSITFRSFFDLERSELQGSVSFSVNVPFNDTTPMRELIANLTKSKFKSKVEA